MGKNAKKALKHVANKAKKAVAKSKAMIDQLETGAPPPAKFLGASAPKLAPAAPKLQDDQFGETSVPKLKLYEMEDVLFQQSLVAEKEDAAGAQDDFLKALHDEEVKKSKTQKDTTVGGVVYPAGVLPSKKHTTDHDAPVPVTHHHAVKTKTISTDKFAFLRSLATEEKQEAKKRKVNHKLKAASHHGRARSHKRLGKLYKKFGLHKHAKYHMRMARHHLRRLRHKLKRAKRSFAGKAEAALRAAGKDFRKATKLGKKIHARKGKSQRKKLRKMKKAAKKKAKKLKKAAKKNKKVKKGGKKGGKKAMKAMKKAAKKAMKKRMKAVQKHLKKVKKAAKKKAKAAKKALKKKIANKKKAAKKAKKA